jgi:hypothetical protein
VPQYRAYIVGRDGYAKKAVDLDCPDDGAAIESAKQLVNGHDVDPWAQGRQIIKINSDDPE